MTYTEEFARFELAEPPCKPDQDAETGKVLALSPDFIKHLDVRPSTALESFFHLRPGTNDKQL